MSSTESTKPGVLTLHHLNNSQSQRILWLLEELAVEYQLEYSIIHYTRDPKYQRAPPELASIHQLGRSPTIITPDGRAIVESLTITKYLLQTYDVRRRFASEDWIRDETLCAFSSSSLFPLATQEMLFDIAVRNTPRPFSYIMKRIKQAHDSFYSDAEFQKDMVFLESELGAGQWFNGSELGMSDFVLSWPLDVIAVRGYVDLEKQYPRLDAWKRRKDERPAWKSALEKGNGTGTDGSSEEIGKVERGLRLESGRRGGFGLGDDMKMLSLLKTTQPRLRVQVALLRSHDNRAQIFAEIAAYVRTSVRVCTSVLCRPKRKQISIRILHAARPLPPPPAELLAIALSFESVFYLDVDPVPMFLASGWASEPSRNPFAKPPSKRQWGTPNRSQEALGEDAELAVWAFVAEVACVEELVSGGRRNERMEICGRVQRAYREIFGMGYESFEG
ncbi:hypothetical protein JHW43_000191 [Diplocarpon mali]|nr:hypothetical protein JHW43_000191 [Diplocarpon mali]